jgi:hypothetical protein
MHDVVRADQDRLVPPLVLIEFELSGRLANLRKDFRAGNGGGFNNYPRFVHAEGIVPSVGRVRAVVLRVFFKFHNFNDFDDDFGLAGAIMNRFHKNDPPWVDVQQ